jgi:hypothetical protein
LKGSKSYAIPGSGGGDNGVKQLSVSLSLSSTESSSLSSPFLIFLMFSLIGRKTRVDGRSSSSFFSIFLSVTGMKGRGGGGVVMVASRMSPMVQVVAGEVEMGAPQLRREC